MKKMVLSVLAIAVLGCLAIGSVKVNKGAELIPHDPVGIAAFK